MCIVAQDLGDPMPNRLVGAERTRS
jgi:hypothetical protein